MHPLFPTASALTETVTYELLDVPVGLLINFHDLRVIESLFEIAKVPSEFSDRLQGSQSADSSRGKPLMRTSEI